MIDATSVHSTSKKLNNTNGTLPSSSKKIPECIDLEDDIIVLDETSNIKIGPRLAHEASPVPEDPSNNISTTKIPELSSYVSLLNSIQAYIDQDIRKNENVDRRILDVLLAAINIQVQKEPHSVRKLILDKQLILPNSISLPPSQVVDLVIEHDPEQQLSKVINRIFGEERPRISEIERKDRHMIRANSAAPNMTRLLMEIGQDLAQEVTYGDIVHTRNLPEAPKNIETYKHVASQLKPIWESLRAKNEPFHLNTHTCHVCNFKSENQTVMNIHLHTLHFDGRKYQCTHCSEFDTNASRMMRHYMEFHEIRPVMSETKSGKVECLICDQDFNSKGQRDMHLKICRRDVNKLRTVQSARGPEHISMINRWLWDKPPVETSIITPPPQTLIRQQSKLIAQQKKLTPNLALAHQHEITVKRPFARTSVQFSQPTSTKTLLAQRQLLMQHQQTKQTPGQQMKPVNNLIRNIVGNPQIANLNTQLAQTAFQLRQHQYLTNINACKQIFANHAKNSLQDAQLKQVIASLSSHASTLQRGNSSGISKNTITSISKPPSINKIVCEICDQTCENKEVYLKHLQHIHDQMAENTVQDMNQGAPLACSRCKDRFWTYEGLERHLLMDHSLVTCDLLQRAQKNTDKGNCKKCGRTFAFNLVQHLAKDHAAKLCSAEILYSCDVCSYKCTSYHELEKHLKTHPKNL